jgi:hypothetical protein
LLQETVVMLVMEVRVRLEVPDKSVVPVVLVVRQDLEVHHTPEALLAW